MKSDKLKQSRSDIFFDGIVYTILIIVLISTLYPLIFILSASVSEPTAIYSGQVWLWPKGLNFEGYRRIFRDSSVLIGYTNSIEYTSIYTILTLFVTIPCAYALSRKDLVGRNIFMMFFTLTMFLSGGIIPKYLLIKSLHLLNSRWAIILPGLVSAYNIIITRTFFQSNIPNELLEAAQIDGCGNKRFFLSIVIPLSKSILAVIALFAAVSMWNQYFNALMYLTDRNKLPLQNILREILVQSEVNTSMLDDIAAVSQMQKMSEILKYALIIVSSLPMLLLYPFIQKHFVTGVMIGSIKG